MTLDDFDAFREECYQRGLTHVQTAAGKLDLADWHPYGAFGGNNPGIEKHIGGFRWINATQAADYGVGEPSSGVNGVWTFHKEEIDDGELLRQEQESNYLRGLGV